MGKLYCVTFGGVVKPYYAFFMPWNAVRDEEAYSLTYLPPSTINGIEEELHLEHDSIVRHKLTFSKNGMQREMNKRIVYLPKGETTHTIHTRHMLVNPTIILAFKNREDAEYAMTQVIYGGQFIYPLYPNREEGIKEYTHSEFDKLEGVETIETEENDENAIFLGFNRQKENKRMFVNIIRNEWV